MSIEDFNNKQFDIFGSKWTINIVDNIEPEVDEDGYKHHYAGMTHNVTQKIEIARNVKEEKLSNEIMCKTLIHELVQVICNTGAYFEKSNDEPFVEFMARGIISLLKQDILCK